MVREYVQSTKFSQYNLPATTQEQFVSLEIPPEYPAQWQTQGFTHLHFGAVRLALTFHGRKGLPVAARIALLDSRHRHYRDAVITIVQTTLNAGTVIFTVFPNFNMSLQDPTLLSALKVQLQLTEIDMDPNSISSTLHYQMVYRIQNHAMDLTLPGTADALMINTDSQNVPMVSQIPRQISVEKLREIILDTWITNYEKLHQSHVGVQSSDATFTTQKDGSTLITFNKAEKAPNNYFPDSIYDAPFTYSPPPRTDGPIIPTEWEEDPDDHPRSSSPPSPPETPPVLPCYKQAQKYLQRTGQQPIIPMQMTPSMALPQICMMSPANYEEDFPPLQRATTNDGIETRQPKVLNSRTVELDGTFKRVAPAEAVLNWQSKNLIAQNKTILEKLESQIQMLHQELRSLAMTSSFSSRLFAEKEAEMKSLQTQLTALQKQAHGGFTEPSEVPWRYTTIPKQEQPLPVVPQKEDHIKRLMRLLDEDDALRKLKGKQKELSSSSQMMVQPQSQKQNPLTAMIKNHYISTSSEPEAEQTPLQPIMMNQPPPEPMMSEVQDETPEVTQQPRQPAQTSKTTSNGKVQLITLNDIPPSQWRDGFHEFKAFLFLQVQKPHSQPREILLDFASRFTGILYDWWVSLGEYKQLMFLQTESIEAALSQLYAEFCGQETQIVEKARSEYFKMRCCSMNKNDLEVHFQKMSRRFYLIGGINDPNLKQAFLSSIPEPLGDETSRLLSAANKHIADITFGEICQFILRAIDKMCSQNKFLQEYMKQIKIFDKICINKELYTKCPNNPTPRCSCSSCSSKPSSRTRKFRKKKGFRRNKFFSKKKDHGSSSGKEEISVKEDQPSASSVVAKTTS
ncbi:hypothetical protein TIFTF001_034955 [Ficus carica]|uniref:Polyprotein n=1 Tax=Ficus carica TaxID=3494 RepID=A0AA88J9N1_FICCA|nr:hypothetical protein TIFTF001_034955 [Ficus carica]